MAAENLDDDDKDIVTCHLHACLRLAYSLAVIRVLSK
jgi:hypothetical protein